MRASRCSVRRRDALRQRQVDVHLITPVSTGRSHLCARGNRPWQLPTPRRPARARHVILATFSAELGSGIRALPRPVNDPPSPAPGQRKSPRQPDAAGARPSLIRPRSSRRAVVNRLGQHQQGDQGDTCECGHRGSLLAGKWRGPDQAADDRVCVVQLLRRQARHARDERQAGRWSGRVAAGRATSEPGRPAPARPGP